MHLMTICAEVLTENSLGSNEMPMVLSVMVPDAKRLSVTVGTTELVSGDNVP